MNRSVQKAGTNSQQIAVSGDYYAGVTPNEAIKIAELVAEKVVVEYTAEALSEAKRRIDDFDERLVPVVESLGALDAFRDPPFQILVKKAQRSAASSGRAEDFDRLAELVANRAVSEGDRVRDAAIDQAVQVVDLVDDGALRGLTITRLLLLYLALDGPIEAGLERFDLFMQVHLDGDLPAGEQWIEHLESLGLLRTARGEAFHTIPQMLTDRFPGWVAPGVDGSDTEKLRIATAAGYFGNVFIPLIPHELKPGFFRYSISSEAHLRQVIEQNPTLDETLVRKVLADHSGFPTPETGLGPELQAAAEKYASLSTVFAWFRAVPVAFRLSQAGLMLATANSSRLNAAARAAGLLT